MHQDQFLLHNLILIFNIKLMFNFLFLSALAYISENFIYNRLRKISSSSLSGSIATAFDNQSLLVLFIFYHFIFIISFIKTVYSFSLTIDYYKIDALY